MNRLLSKVSASLASLFRAAVPYRFKVVDAHGGKAHAGLLTSMYEARTLARRLNDGQPCICFRAVVA